jgi:SAM-dependent methyltransferase
LGIKITRRGHIVYPKNLLESEEHMKMQARKRWIEAKPTLHLSWNKEVTGEAFIKKILKYVTFQPDKNILEIGPGYGRLLKAILKENLSFKNYYGIDPSAENISYLKRIFTTPNIHFICGYAEDIRFDITFDIVISSLTFKHIFPTFEKLSYNVSTHMKKGGLIFFDLIEGNVAFFDEDGTYIKYYSRSQIKDILQHSMLELVAFDNVIHSPVHSRLLVIAKKST